MLNGKGGTRDRGNECRRKLSQVRGERKRRNEGYKIAHTFQSYFSYLGDLSLILSVSKSDMAKQQGMLDRSMYVRCTVDKRVSRCTVPRYHAGHVCTCHEGSLGHSSCVNQQLNALLHLQDITSIII
jgi:hypothetical protein